MGLFSFIGGLIGGGAQKKAVSKATNQQLAALQQAIDEQRRQFDLTRGDLSPAREALAPSTGGIQDLLGLNGNDKSGAAIEALKNSPFYQSLYRNGLEANLQNASATGGIRGGNEVRSLADFGSDTLMQTIQQQLGSLGSLAGLGLGATEAGAGFGQHTADAVGSLFGQQGAARASGTLARGGITAGMWNNAGGFLDNAIQAAIGAGAGPGGAGFNLGQFFKGF
jgi:hypothetical protein